MIKGSIITNTEPAYFRRKNTSMTYFPHYGDDDYDNWYNHYPSNQPNYNHVVPLPTNGHNYSATMEQNAKLQNDLDLGAQLGLVVGAIVQRAKGLKNKGKIIRVCTTWQEAYNTNNDYIEPFKVLWENREYPHLLTQLFNYGVDELELYKKQSASPEQCVLY